MRQSSTTHQTRTKTALALSLLLLVGCRLPSSLPSANSTLTVEDHSSLHQIDGISPEQLSLPSDVAPPDSEPIPDRRWRPSSNAQRVLPIEMPLEEARLSALSGNLDLRVVRVTPTIAAQAVTAEQGAFEKTFNQGVSWRRVDDPSSPPDESLGNWSSSFNIPLTSGGNLQFDYDFDRSESHDAKNDRSGLSGLGLGLKQPLLRGFGYDVNTSGIRIASYRLGSVSADSKLRAIRVAADVERSYWRLWSSYKLLDIAKQQKELAVKQVEIAKLIVKAERLPAVEITRAEAGSLSRDNAVIVAETELGIASRELKKIMQKPDLPVSSTALIQPTTRPVQAALKFDRSSVTQMAINNRVELLQLRLDTFSNWVRQQVARNSRLPRLDLIAQIHGLGLDQDFGGSLDDLFDGRHGDGSVGLNLQVPLSGNISATARLRQAEVEQWLLQLRQQQQTVEIEQQVLNAIDRVEQGWKRVAVNALATVAAEQTYEAEAKLNQAGERTSTEVFLVLSNLANAQANEILAIRDFQIAKVDLAEATGTVLGFARIQWDPSEGMTGHE